MEISFADICGYLGSALVVASFMLKDLRKIRIVNLAGCLFFVIYGVLKGGGRRCRNVLARHHPQWISMPYPGLPYF